MKEVILYFKILPYGCKAELKKWEGERKGIEENGPVFLETSVSLDRTISTYPYITKLLKRT